MLIDNIAGSLGSASLDAALTGTTWKDRILGKSEIVEFPLLATWYATGNNVVLMADTARRTCHIRLSSPLENPEERTGFKHADLRGHVRKHRSELLGAALTILRAWFVADQPDMKLKPWDSFEGWSDIVRNSVVWTGITDPEETREELRNDADNEEDALRALIVGWAELDPQRVGLTASKALELIERHPADYEIIRTIINKNFTGRDGKWPSPRSLGMRLHHLRGRIVGRKFLNCRSVEHTKHWYIAEVDTPAEGGTSGTTGTNQPDVYAGRAREHAYAKQAEIVPLVPPQGKTCDPGCQESATSENVKHKQDDCTSTRAWLHVWGKWYCNDCWPCTDETMRVSEQNMSP